MSPGSYHSDIKRGRAGSSNHKKSLASQECQCYTLRITKPTVTRSSIRVFWLPACIRRASNEHQPFFHLYTTSCDSHMTQLQQPPIPRNEETRSYYGRISGTTNQRRAPGLPIVIYRGLTGKNPFFRKKKNLLSSKPLLATSPSLFVTNPVLWIILLLAPVLGRIQLLADCLAFSPRPHRTIYSG